MRKELIAGVTTFASSSFGSSLGAITVATVPTTVTTTASAGGLAGLLGVTTTVTSVVTAPVTVPVAGVLAVGALLTIGGVTVYQLLNNQKTPNNERQNQA